MWFILVLFALINCGDIGVKKYVVSELDDTFILNATEVNPYIIEYEKNGIPFAVYWQVRETSHGDDKRFHTESEQVIHVVNVSSLFIGENSFMLRVINLRDFTVNTTFCNITVLPSRRKSYTNYTTYDLHYMKSMVFYARLENTCKMIHMILSPFIVLQYKASKLCFELIRVLYISMQYLLDRMYMDVIISGNYIAIWEQLDLNVTHYSYTGFNSNSTLDDYFKWNNNAPYYDVSMTLVTTIEKAFGL